MIHAWRIIKAKHKNKAFSGEGSLYASGRWHNQIVPMVYCSDSLALAALETFVHIGENGKQIKFVSFEIHIPPSLILDVENIDTLPKRWRKEPPGAITKKIGSQWIQSSTSAVLSVPSCIIPTERNYLLNPHHPDFDKVLKKEPVHISFDARMWK